MVKVFLGGCFYVYMIYNIINVFSEKILQNFLKIFSFYCIPFPPIFTIPSIFTSSCKPVITITNNLSSQKKQKSEPKNRFAQLCNLNKKNIISLIYGIRKWISPLSACNIAICKFIII